MGRHLGEHPALKYLFFGGKGGVGKTVFAGAAAIGLARQGRRTLLASTNPVHSLTSLLGQDVLGKHVAVEDVPNLWAYEIETKADASSASKVEIREKIRWFLKFADITTKADEFVETATMNPAFEESAMFENMIDLMFKNEYDVYVFDTAPTANARRLLGMSKVYSLWVNKMLKSREEARSASGDALLHEEKGGGPAAWTTLSPSATGWSTRACSSRTRAHGVLLRDAAGGAADRGGHALHPVVQGLRDPRGRRPGQHGHRRRVGSARTPPISSRTAWPCSRSTCGRSGGSSTTASAPSCRSSRPRSAACRCSSDLCDAIFADDGAKPAAGDTAGAVRTDV